MTTFIDSPPRHRGAGRIIERTTTVTREVYIDDPAPEVASLDRAEPRALRSDGSSPDIPAAACAAGSVNPSAAASAARSDADLSAGDTAPFERQALSGLNRFAVQVGIRIAAWGRRRAMRRSVHRRSDGAEISRRLQATKARDLRFLAGPPL